MDTLYEKEERVMIQSTLCYIERAGQYLMLHRVKKENDLNHDKWVGSAANFWTRRVRRNVCCGRSRRRLA